jgi:hypothetical protein
VNAAGDLMLDQPGHPCPVELLIGVQRRDGRGDDSEKASLTHLDLLERARAA